MWRKKSIVDEALMFWRRLEDFLRSTLMWKKKPIVDEALIFWQRLEDFLRSIKALLYEA
jgi:inhibitor of KinA sporulation pathway (predicted exonuclease)